MQLTQAQLQIAETQNSRVHAILPPPPPQGRKSSEQINRTIHSHESTVQTSINRASNNVHLFTHSSSPTMEVWIGLKNLQGEMKG